MVNEVPLVSQGLIRVHLVLVRGQGLRGLLDVGHVLNLPWGCQEVKVGAPCWNMLHQVDAIGRTEHLKARAVHLQQDRGSLATISNLEGRVLVGGQDVLHVLSLVRSLPS